MTRRYIHISKPIVRDPQSGMPVAAPIGFAYNVGRNKAKRAERARRAASKGGAQ